MKKTKTFSTASAITTSSISHQLMTLQYPSIVTEIQPFKDKIEQLKTN